MLSANDNSPDLKKGEIKKILITTSEEVAPDFTFLDYKTGIYTFQRTRAFRRYEVFELFHIGFSFKHNFFSASVASRLNPSYIHNRTFNSGILNPHLDLISLKSKSKSILIEEAYYSHNGQVQMTKNIARQIFEDFNNYGVELIDSQFERLNKNEIIKQGIDFVEQLRLTKQILQNELELELKKVRYLISNIKHPKYLELKKHLQAVSRQTKEDRKLIPTTTLELLEVYCAT